MSAWSRMRKRLPISGLAAGALALSLVTVNMALPASGVKAAPVKPFCAVRPQLCTETTEPWNYLGQYTGHDEPSLEFYSSEQGSGNNSIYLLRLPKDPPVAPNQNGTGGTANFQLHPAFWFGMDMCDNQSAPNPGPNCVPDSDQNIFDSTNPKSPQYIGNTPGQGFMEMQFYPPGWGNVGEGVSCGPDNTQWCAALNIDSFSQNSNTGVLNNAACLGAVGEEYVNYAIITKSGKSQAPADPLRQTAATFETGPDTLEMNSGDVLRVDLHDTPAGFQVVISDMTTGQVGSMTASIANGFGHPLFQPSSSTCTDQPYAFHPMFGTSSPKTRVYWAAHSYNIAYSDEIGHFEYCNAADPTTLACTSAGVTDPGGLDSDDQPCWTLPLVNYTTPMSLTGCLGSDEDFDGPEYGHNWPGSDSNPVADAYLHAQPVAFSSPLFADPSSTGLHNYQQAAFETDLPRIEGSDSSPNNSCERHIVNPSDPNPGVNCVIPPIGATFYPFFSTVSTSGGACVWEEGDKYLPNAINRFGGTAAAEYGSLLDLTYPDAGFVTGQIYEDFHRTLPNNPCPAPGGSTG